MPGSTARLAMPLPLGADAVAELRLAITAIANTLDTAALARSGTLAARPAANTLSADTLYRCTDTPAWYVTDGSAWHYVPLDGNSQPVGAITQYAGTVDPVDVDGTTRWVICNGRTLAAASFPTLSARIGTTYGGTAANFAIPDLRGRVPVGAGQGAGLTNRVLASTGGEETHLLSVSEMPAHTHPGSTVNAPGRSFQQGTAGAEANVLALNSAGTVAIAAQGGSATHNNMQSYLVVNHIIKVL